MTKSLHNIQTIRPPVTRKRPYTRYRTDFDEALELLSDHRPRAPNEWVALHIRGMVQLKRGNYSEATDIFSRGIQQCPFYRNRRYFENALATLKICRTQHQRGDCSDR